MSGRDLQQSPQQEAVRSRHGRSRPQATQEACRTIRAVSRPNCDSVCSTEHIVLPRSPIVMSEELKDQKPMRIVAAMKKSSCFLLFLFVTVPAFAQTGQQFGILFGGAKRLYSGHDKHAADIQTPPEVLPIDRFRLTHGVREIF